ncbi:hypothetical protein HZA85_03855 [Candidatus Uhrbacteria bacterium]|nr:hypothetical protein [Candidatus Uhrbacteria bacterium]
MEKETWAQTKGYVALAFILLAGVALLFDAQYRLTTSAKAQQERERPADLALTLITPADCPQCVDGTGLIEQIEKQPVRLKSTRTLSAASDEGSALIQSAEVERLPVVIVEGEFDKENVREIFAKLQAKQKDQKLLIQPGEPVYQDVANQQIVGLVDLTYLKDSGCSDCYDPANHKSLLERSFGLAVQSEMTVEAESPKGRELIKKYAITELPTVLLSAQAGTYPTLMQAWGQVGSVESDSTLVFRKNAALGPVIYKDLKTGEIVRPAPTQP